ncbi:cupredoxin domain-containing protein, partial [Streptococcus pyogenes]|uniref:cupredoxin domain-containing protein n=1 Tax=Streptococcus pyogenes TaxID=1314 RepID=UPI003DA1C29D
ATQGTVHKIVLKTGMAGGKMVYMDDKGAVNPTIKGKVGDTVEITIRSGEGAQHDIVVDELKVRSPMFDGKSQPTKVVFKLTQSGKFTYYCSVPGHRQIGMEGLL